MGLRDRIRAWLLGPDMAVVPTVDLREAERGATIVAPAKLPAIMRLEASSSNRAELELPPLDFNLLTRAVRSDSLIYQAVCKYVDLVFKEGWDLKSKNPRALEYVRLRLRLIAASTSMPTSLLLQALAEDLIIYGNAYLVKARQSGSYTFPRGIRVRPVNNRPPVVGYFVLPPSTIQVERGPDGRVTRYAQVLPGQSQPKYLRAEDVVHFAWKPPRGEAYGYPFLLAAIDDARMLRKIEDDLLRLIHIHTYPIQVLQVGLPEPGKQATQEEINQLKEEARQWEPDEMLVLSERHKVYLVGAEGEALDLTNYLRYAEQRLFTALGVPETVMGRGQTSNRATADILAAEMHDAVKSYQRLIAAVFTHQVLTELLYEGGFDPILRPDEQVELAFREIAIDERIKQETHAVFKYEHNAITFQEMRYELGLDPEVDESQMYLNRHQIPLAQVRSTTRATNDANTADTDNRIRPTNQYGTKTSPKRLSHGEPPSPLEEASLKPSAVNPRISVVGRQLKRLWRRLGEDLAELAAAIAQDPKAAQLADQELSATRQAMTDVMASSIMLSLQHGARQVRAPADTVHIYTTRLAMAAEQDLDRLLSDLEPFFVRAVEQKQPAVVKEGIEALDFRLELIADFRLRQAFHTGVLAGLAALGVPAVTIRHPAGSSCPRCRSSTERLALNRPAFDPAGGPLPQHPGCDCYYQPEE